MWHPRPSLSPLSLLSLLSLLSFSFLGCRTTAPPAEPENRRVVLLSLDGAAAETLHRLWREGALTAGGFRQFFEKGQVADRLVPVNPTLTAVNHISLATGRAPGATGIVSNRFHPADAPLLQAVSGFDAPIGTPTLWEAARRQGRRVGIVTWPGADGKSEARKGDWGMSYVNDALGEPDLAVLSRADWAAADPADPRLKGVRSFAPILRAALPQRGLDVAALDRTDDGRTSYDAILPLDQGPGPDRTALAAGDWGSVGWASPAGRRQAWIKLLAIAPDLSSTRIYLNGVFANAAYPETFAGELADSGLIWPGPPDDRRLADTWQGKPGIDLATWSEQSERFTGFFGAALRFAAARSDWDLLMGYIPTIDEAGHQLLLADERQPNFSRERREAFDAARLRVWQEVDRELAALLRVLDLRETQVVIVSDHGMLPVHTAVDPNVLLRDQALLATEGAKVIPEGTTANAISSGAVSNVYVDAGNPDRERILNDLRTRYTEWTLDGARPIARAVLRAEAGPLGLDHPNSGDLILFAAPGFTFYGGGLREGRAAIPTPVYGMHGHLAGDPALDGIWLALGAGIGKGKAGTVRAVDVAPRVASWLGFDLGGIRP